jgi:hypothetical protein
MAVMLNHALNNDAYDGQNFLSVEIDDLLTRLDDRVKAAQHPINKVLAENAAHRAFGYFLGYQMSMKRTA